MIKTSVFTSDDETRMAEIWLDQGSKEPYLVKRFLNGTEVVQMRFPYRDIAEWYAEDYALGVENK